MDNDHPDSPKKFAVALFTRPSKRKGQLNIVKGDRITDITKTQLDGWLIGRGPNGETGKFPDNHVKFVSNSTQQLSSRQSNNYLEQNNSSQHFHFNGDITINNTKNTANIDVSKTETTNAVTTNLHDESRSTTTESYDQSKKTEILDQSFTTTGTATTITTTTTNSTSSNTTDRLRRGFSTVLDWVAGLLRSLGLPKFLATPLAWLLVLGLLILSSWMASYSYMPWPFSWLSAPFWVFSQIGSIFASFLGFDSSAANPKVVTPTGSQGTTIITSSSWGRFWSSTNPDPVDGLEQNHGTDDDGNDNNGWLDFGFSQHNNWIINTDLTRMGDFNMYHDTAHSAWELAVKLESQPEGGGELITLQLNGQLISTSLEVAKDNIQFTEEQHQKLVNEFMDMIKKDRKVAKSMHETLRRRNSSIEAARSSVDSNTGSQTIRTFHLLHILCYWGPTKAWLPTSWCYEPPPPITARKILATRLQQWDICLQGFMQSRSNLLGGLLCETDGSKGPSNTCKAKRDTDKILDWYEKSSWMMATKEKHTEGSQGEAPDEELSSTDVRVITPEDRTSLYVLDAKSQLICDWHNEVLDWGNDRKTLVEDEVAWIEKARQRVDNNWVDYGDAGDKNERIVGDVDDEEIRRVEQLIADQALEWIQQLKEHWESLY